jgi:hypothetical protein
VLGKILNQCSWSVVVEHNSFASKTNLTGMVLHITHLVIFVPFMTRLAGRQPRPRFKQQIETSVDKYSDFARYFPVKVTSLTNVEPRGGETTAMTS